MLRNAGLISFFLKSGSEVGGNCRTIRVGDFLFDTGAHRFHDKDSNVTSEVKKLLGSDLFHVDAPSEIFFEGQFYQFSAVTERFGRETGRQNAVQDSLG